MAARRADFVSVEQRGLGLELLPLALVDGLELKNDMVGLK
jgi:hypothetical protein